MEDNLHVADHMRFAVLLLKIKLLCLVLFLFLKQIILVSSVKGDSCRLFRSNVFPKLEFRYGECNLVNSTEGPDKSHNSMGPVICMQQLLTF